MAQGVSDCSVGAVSLRSRLSCVRNLDRGKKRKLELEQENLRFDASALTDSTGNSISMKRGGL